MNGPPAKDKRLPSASYSLRFFFVEKDRRTLFHLSDHSGRETERQGEDLPMLSLYIFSRVPPKLSIGG